MNFFSFNFFCTSPAPPPISFLMVRPLEERFRLLKNLSLDCFEKTLEIACRTGAFFSFGAFLAFCRLKKAVFTGIKIEPTKSGNTVKSTRLHKQKRGIFSPL